MNQIANIIASVSEDASAKAHPGEACWDHVMAQLSALFESRAVHPAKALVLLPYAQLMQPARDAWAAGAARIGKLASFVPRFETTMNWAGSVAVQEGAFAASAQDLQQDVAIDALTAASLLVQAGLSAEQGLLTGRLVEATWSLAKVAAAQAPENRLAWGARQASQPGMGLDAPALALELAVARIALAWASASSYPTDALFSADLELFVVLEGFQSEPVTEALKSRFGDRTVTIQLPAPGAMGELALHVAQDAENEAQRAAACVLSHLAAGRSPVALIAQDRVLTRRIRAMLAESDVAIRDETGWKLSTTRAAAALMSLIQSIKLNGHDPYAYPKDVLARLPTQKNNQIEDLLPHRWRPLIK